MLSLTTETPATLHQIAAMFPGHGDKEQISYHTVYTWATTGVRGVVLETIMLGGKRLTTYQALDRFVQATNQKSKKDSTSTIRQAKSKRFLAAKKRLKQNHGI